MPTNTEVSPHEVAVRGEEWYERHLKQQVEPDHLGQYLVVDVNTGDYEIGRGYIQPTELLLARHPDAVLYPLCVGYRSVGRIGGRYTPVRR